MISHSIEEELNHEGYMHEGAVSARIGVPGIPYISEDIAVARELHNFRNIPVRMYILHMLLPKARLILSAAPRQGE